MADYLKKRLREKGGITCLSAAARIEELEAALLAADEYEALRSERDALRTRVDAAQKDAEAWARKCASADDRCEAIAAERDALREALAPFAALPDPRNSGAKHDVDPVWGVNGVCLTVGDFRRARAITGRPSHDRHRQHQRRHQ